MTDLDLDRALHDLASAPVLLVASDYDGTLAPIVEDPDQARPQRESVVALRLLASFPQTHVAVISGRGLADLGKLTGLPDDVHLVGSHGSEFDLDFASSLPADAAALRRRLEEALTPIVARDAGFLMETKPASIAFHYRRAGREAAEAAVEDVLNGPGSWAGVVVKRGKMVVELGVVSTDKGRALESIRRSCGASAVLFCGDDVTDEDAFGTLAGPDVGVKVGPGESRARFRVDGPGDVSRLLARLGTLRSDWLAGSRAVPIEQHSLLSDQRAVALVTPEARVTWCCFPRLDSAALFAELLGGPSAGHFSVGDVSGDPAQGQEYLDDTLVLRTRWPRFTVTDFLDCSEGRPLNRAGRSELVRILRGSGRVWIEFAPRLDYGRGDTRIRLREGGLEVEATDPIVLRSPGVTWSLREEGLHHIARAEVDLTPENPVVLELRYGTGSLREGHPTADDRSKLTQRFWSSWASRLRVPDMEPDLVRRSALVLAGLIYRPSGAVAAAATTSLPEHMGGVRNWDYRFCWIRDAALTAHALVELDSMSEATHFLDWTLGVLARCESPERLQPLYTLLGDVPGAEAEISELSGYAGSRPVRLGNAAAHQIQLDVFGPVVDLVASLMERDVPLSTEHWRLVESMVKAVERRWQEPDHGIWEIRKPRRHHVHSKVMCWITVERALAVSRGFLDREREEWRGLRDAIAEDVLTHGFKTHVGAFTAAYDGDDVDASALHVGLSGLLPAHDERFRGTVEAVEQQLRNGPTVYRYRSDDGLPGFEGGFHICASWLVDSYLLLGRRDDAEALFRDIAALAGPTGMLSEQYGPKTRRALGNVPQAYSHLGLIRNAVNLSRG